MRWGGKWIWIAGLLLLAATIGVPAWMLNRDSTTTPQGGPALESLDVVCTGYVEPQSPVRALDPPLVGRVTAVLVQEGDEVKQGQPLLTMDDRAYADAVKDAIAAREIAVLDLERVREQEKKDTADIDAGQKAIEAATLDADALERRLMTMRSQLGITDRVPFTKGDVEALELQVKAARKKIEAEQDRVNTLKSINRSLAEKAAVLRLDSAKEAVARAERYVKECTMTAPADGMIVRVQAAVGAVASPGSPLEPAITFAPSGPLVVRAEVEQADAGFLKLGQKASVKDDSRRNSPTWTGTVTRISPWVARKRSINLNPGEFNDVRTLEAIITLEPSPHRLWIGQRMVVRLTKGN